jgi:hypothetical protein
LLIIPRREGLFSALIVMSWALLMIVEKVSGMCVQLFNIMMCQWSIVLSAICSMIAVFQWRIYYAWQETVFAYSVSSSKIFCVLNTLWPHITELYFHSLSGVSISEFFKSIEAYAVRSFSHSVIFSLLNNYINSS